MDIIVNNQDIQIFNNYKVNDAYEFVSQVTDIESYDFVQVVAEVEKVRKAVCYTLQSGEVLVGVLTEPLFSLSERMLLKQKIEQKVADITKKDVFVTLDTDLFVQISKCKDEQSAQDIKQLIFVRNMARM